MRGARSTLLFAAVVAMAGLAAANAAADPNLTPPTTSIVAVGSDNGGLSPLFNQFSTDYNATTPYAQGMYSWDAVGPSSIESKRDAQCSLTRPYDTSTGVAQLRAKLMTADGHYCVDIARSARDLASSDGTALAAKPFAHDLITYAIVNGGYGVPNLDDGELTAIYACNASLIPAADRIPGGNYGDFPVLWYQVGGIGTDPVVPVLPQASSDTGPFGNHSSDTGIQWFSDLQEFGSAPAPCVVNGTSTVDGSPIKPNEGTNSEFSTANPYAKDIIFPYSAGNYVGETITKSTPASPGSLVLGTIDGLPPLTPANATPANQINTSGYTLPTTGAYHHPAFPMRFINALSAVTLSTGTSPWVPNYLQPFETWLCGATAATSITHYGFTPYCGTVTHQ